MDDSSLTPSPIYTGENLNSSSCQLCYGWTGWDSNKNLSKLPNSIFHQFQDGLEQDGIRILEHQNAPSRIQMTTRVSEEISPVSFTRIMKGRLQHLLKEQDIPVDFSRKVTMTSIGETRSDIVNRYIQNQVKNSDYADPKYRNLLQSFTEQIEGVDLSEPEQTNSGRYWYNLHLVLVTSNRYRMKKEDSFRKTRNGCSKIAEKKNYGISAISLMPDHLHIALRGNIKHSPLEIALSFMNNLSYIHGQNAIWEYSFYTGTFGSYDMNAVKNR